MPGLVAISNIVSLIEQAIRVSQKPLDGSTRSKSSF